MNISCKMAISLHRHESVIVVSLFVSFGKRVRMKEAARNERGARRLVSKIKAFKYPSGSRYAEMRPERIIPAAAVVVSAWQV